MNNNTWVKVASLSTVLVGALSVPAFAGGASSYVENDFSVRNICNGRSSTNVNVDSNYDFTRSATSVSTKEGTSLTTTSQSAVGHTDGFDINQSFNETDDFNISATTTITENGSGSETKAVVVSDSYSYNGIDKTHRVTTGFSY